jgi:DNA/RNA endonuclease YhcR with UshA esterase domain
MKLRYYFIALLGLLFFATSCEEDTSITLLDEVQVSSSYVAIPVGGGSTKIVVTATEAWEIKAETVPAWLTVSPATGAAGETTVTFSAESTLDGRKGTLDLNCAGKTQKINVIQGLSTISKATCAEVIAGPENKTFLVTGVCTAIANTQYGNWYLNDGTGEIYIYGTVNASGSYAWSSFNIEVGDEVTVQGPKKIYNGIIELVDATFISVSKSLIKVDSLSVSPVAIEGGEFQAYLTCKGNGVTVTVPEEAKSWLQVTGIVTRGNEAIVTFVATPNEGGDRSTTLVFNTTDGKKSYTAQASLMQNGAILEVSVADFLAAEVGAAQYKVTGAITKVAKVEYGNVYIKDHSGELYVYGIGSKGDFQTLGLKEGDIVTLIGQRGEYKGSPQMAKGQYESHIPVTTLPINEFVAKEDNKNIWYRISGIVRAANEEELELKK